MFQLFENRKVIEFFFGVFAFICLVVLPIFFYYYPHLFDEHLGTEYSISSLYAIIFGLASLPFILYLGTKENSKMHIYFGLLLIELNFFYHFYLSLKYFNEIENFIFVFVGVNFLFWFLSGFGAFLLIYDNKNLKKNGMIKPSSE